MLPELLLSSPRRCSSSLVGNKAATGHFPLHAGEIRHVGLREAVSPPLPCENSAKNNQLLDE